MRPLLNPTAPLPGRIVQQLSHLRSTGFSVAIICLTYFPLCFDPVNSVTGFRICTKIYLRRAPFAPLPPKSARGTALPFLTVLLKRVSTDVPARLPAREKILGIHML